MAIGTAALVAVGTFFQFARNAGVPWSSPVVWLLLAAASAVVLSMVLGFVAISTIYKRADGRIDAGAAAWSTQPVRRFLTWQGNVGLASLCLVLAALVVWGMRADERPALVALTLYSGTSALPGAGSLRIEGVWTSLKLRTAAGQELSLPPQSQPISLSCQ